MTTSGTLARQAVLVVPDNVVRGSFIGRWQAGAALRDFEELFAQARAADTANTSQTFAQRLHDCCRQSLAGCLRDFTGEAICFGILDTQRHIGV